MENVAASGYSTATTHAESRGRRTPGRLRESPDGSEGSKTPQKNESQCRGEMIDTAFRVVIIGTSFRSHPPALLRASRVDNPNVRRCGGNLLAMLGRTGQGYPSSLARFPRLNEFCMLVIDVKPMRPIWSCGLYVLRLDKAVADRSFGLAWRSGKLIIRV